MKKLIFIPLLIFSLTLSAQFTKSGGTFLKTGNYFTSAPSLPNPFPQIISVTETTTNISDRTSHAITMPAEVDEGDLLIVLFSSDATTETDPISIDEDNSDDGWTNANPSVAATSVVVDVFWKIADSDGDTLTVLTNNAQMSVAQTYRITNFESSDPVKITFASSPTGDQYPNPPSGTGDYGADDYLWIVAYGGDAWDSYATAAPDNFTGLETTYVNQASICSINSAYREYNVNGAYDPGTFTANTSDEAWMTYTIIVNPIQ